MLMSLTSVGTFNGVVKYVSEYKSDQKNLLKLFSTLYVVSFTASVLLFFILFFGASYLSNTLFFTNDYVVVFKVTAVAVPFISMHRIFTGVINGLSDYKKHAKIELISYFFGIVLLLVSLYFYSLKGVLVAIALTPIIQFTVLIIIFGKLLKEYIDFKSISFNIPLLKPLLGFTLMSFIGTVLLNYIEIDLRTLITDIISEAEAGSWTAMNSISKIYMQFITIIFPIYILPKYATIKTSFKFRKEVFQIYKTLIPLVLGGMLLVYFSRNILIQIIYTKEFLGMQSLFKWQLLGDFVKFVAIVLSYQFLANKQIKYFVVTELLSLFLYYIFGRCFVNDFGSEGIVMAHFLRYVIYLVIVFYILRHQFIGKDKAI